MSMKEKDVISMLEDAMDLERDVLDPMDILEDMPEWDSLSKLSFLTIVKEKAGRTISVNDVATFVVVQDAVDFFKD